MQPERERAEGPVASHDPVGEGRIADRQVEVLRQVDPGEIGIEGPAPRLEKPGNAGGNGVDLDPGHMRSVPQIIGHQRRKKPCSDARLEHTAAAKTEPLQARPDGPDDIFGGEVGILGAARERGIVAGIDGAFQLDADLFPALAKAVLPRPTKHTIGQFGSSKAGEPDQRRLLRGGRRALLFKKIGGEPDRHKIVAGAIAPGSGEAAHAGEMEVFALRCPARELRVRRGGHGARGRLRGRIVIVRIIGRTVGKGGHAEAEPRGQCRIAEQVECEGVVMGHGINLLELGKRVHATGVCGRVESW